MLLTLFRNMLPNGDLGYISVSYFRTKAPTRREEHCSRCYNNPWQRIQGKKPLFNKEESALPSRQCTRVHLCCCSGEVARIEVSKSKILLF